MVTLESAPGRIAAMIERIGRLSRAREAATLAPAQWEALRFLARANAFSRQPSAVAAWLATTKGTASQTLIALERKGLIRKGRHPSDGRSALLEVTPAGLELLQDDPMQDLVETIARLPPLHAAALSQSLAHIMGEMAPAGSRAVMAGCAGCTHLDERPDAAQAAHCRRFEMPVEGRHSSLACVAHTPAD